MNKTRSYKGFLITALLTLSFVSVLGGCSLSPSALTCGTDDGASYVTLENLKNTNPQVLKSFGELCGFDYEQQTGASFDETSTQNVTPEITPELLSQRSTSSKESQITSTTWRNTTVGNAEQSDALLLATQRI